MDINNLSQEELKNLEYVLTDYNSDGFIDTIVKLEKDADGRIQKAHLDFDNDGSVDYIIHLEYYTDGKLFKKYIDKGADGTIDQIETYSYDEAGNKTVIYDDNADGDPDFIEQVDSEGEVVISDLRSKGEKVKELLDVVILNDFKKLFKRK